MSWDLQGQRAAGIYLNAYTVSGIVTESRVKYGGNIQHTLKLDTPITVFGRAADVVLLDQAELFITGAQHDFS